MRDVPAVRIYHQFAHFTDMSVDSFDLRASMNRQLTRRYPLYFHSDVDRLSADGIRKHIRIVGLVSRHRLFGFDVLGLEKWLHLGQLIARAT